MSDTPRITVYLTEAERERWKAEANERDMADTEFVRQMTEAGMSQIDVATEPDESILRLHEQNSELRKEVQHKDEELSRLEATTQEGEEALVEEIISEKPGIDFSEIVQQLADTIPGRTNRHLERLEAQQRIMVGSDGHYYPADGGEQTDEGEG